MGFAFKYQNGVINPCGFHHAAIQRDIAVKHGQAALAGERVLQIAYTAGGAVAIQAWPAGALGESGLSRYTARASLKELNHF